MLRNQLIRAFMTRMQGVNRTQASYAADVVLEVLDAAGIATTRAGFGVQRTPSRKTSGKTAGKPAGKAGRGKSAGKPAGKAGRGKSAGKPAGKAGRGKSAAGGKATPVRKGTGKRTPAGKGAGKGAVVAKSGAKTGFKAGVRGTTTSAKKALGGKTTRGGKATRGGKGTGTAGKKAGGPKRFGKGR